MFCWERMDPTGLINKFRMMKLTAMICQLWRRQCKNQTRNTDKLLGGKEEGRAEADAYTGTTCRQSALFYPSEVHDHSILFCFVLFVYRQGYNNNYYGIQLANYFLDKSIHILVYKTWDTCGKCPPPFFRLQDEVLHCLLCPSHSHRSLQPKQIFPL